MGVTTENQVTKLSMVISDLQNIVEQQIENTGELIKLVNTQQDRISALEKGYKDHREWGVFIEGRMKVLEKGPTVYGPSSIHKGTSPEDIKRHLGYDDGSK